ncbi:MAG: DUF5979 domain-containing protein, partial [Mycobacteriales bacterium]
MSRRGIAARRASRSGAVAATSLIALAVVAGPAAATDEPGLGSLVIRAVTAASAPSASFTFDISCTGDGEPVTRSVVIPTADGVGSATVDGIPLDMACLVHDSAPTGWRVQTTNPQAAVSSAAGTTVEFVHSAPAVAALSITKTSTPDGGYGASAAAPAVARGASLTYVLTWHNAGELPVVAT